MRGDTSATHARHILSPHMHDIHIATHATYIIATQKDRITFTNDYIESEKTKQNNQYIN